MSGEVLIKMSECDYKKLLDIFDWYVKRKKCARAHYYKKTNATPKRRVYDDLPHMTLVET